jgi:hypothetical protein
MVEKPGCGIIEDEGEPTILSECWKPITTARMTGNTSWGP